MVGNTEYEKVFELAEMGNLTREEMCEYNQGLKIERDYFSVMENVKDEGIKIGLEKGREEGREEGIEIGRIGGRKEMALKLKAANATLSLISETTGLTIEQIESL